MKPQFNAMVTETGSDARLVAVTTRPSALFCRIYADKSIKIEIVLMV
jgi:hypothetical protein